MHHRSDTHSHGKGEGGEDDRFRPIKENIRDVETLRWP